MIKAVIFDFFGVICPDLHWTWLSKNIRDLEKHRDFFKDLSDKVDLGLITEEEFIEETSKISDIPSADIKKEMLQMIKIDKDLISLIKKLKKDYKIVLLSSAHHSLLEKILDDNKFSSYFEKIFITSRVGILKSEKKLYQDILRELEIEGTEAIYIDDSNDNIKMAKSLGFKTMHYKNFSSLVNSLKKYNFDI